MPLVNTETKIPQLILDYVESLRTELSIPLAADLPFYAGIRDAVQCTPCVIFYVDAFQLQHPERMTMRVMVSLINDRAANESAEESETAAQIRSALGDHVSFASYLAALSSGARAGWRITKYLVSGGGIEIDPELSQRRRFTSLEVHAITSETTFPV